MATRLHRALETYRVLKQVSQRVKPKNYKSTMTAITAMSPCILKWKVQALFFSKRLYEIRYGATF